MSAIANVVVYDGEATQVAHTFKPIYVRNENGAQVAFYREAIAGVPLDAQPTLTLSQKPLPSGVTRLSARIAIPVMESVSGQNSAGYTAAPKVAYVTTGEVVLYAPSRSTPQQRRNLRYMLNYILFGYTSAGGVTFNSGPVTELFEDVVSPT